MLTERGLNTLPRGSEIRIDGVVVAFTMGLALLVGIVVGLVPVIGIRQMNLSQAFREEGRSGTSGARSAHDPPGPGGKPGRVRVHAVDRRRAAAGKLPACARGRARLRARQPADREGLATGVTVSTTADTSPFVARFLTGVRAIPGVQSAGFTSDLPFGGDFSDSVILAEGYQMAPGESLISPYQVHATPGYLETMRVPLLRGRFFTDGDTDTSTRVVIVDDRLARKFWPGKDPVGRRMFQPDNPQDLTKPGPNPRWYTVVGVVGETKMAGLVTTDDRIGTYYFPMPQDGMRTMTLAVRTSDDPLAIAAAVAARRSRDRSGAAALQRPDDGRPDRRDADRSADADGARRDLRRGRALPGRHRPVTACSPTRWRSAERRSGSEWRSAASRAGIFGLVLREGLTRAGRRIRGRRRRRIRDRSHDGNPAVRRRRDGPDGARAGRRPARRRRTGRVHRAGAPRLADRSPRCIQRMISDGVS